MTTQKFKRQKAEGTQGNKKSEESLSCEKSPSGIEAEVDFLEKFQI